jgi:hypothetical protein
MTDRPELDEHGHAYPGDLTDHTDPDHTDADDGRCIDCAEVDRRGLPPDSAVSR